jgi:hypothetical protein
MEPVLLVGGFIAVIVFLGWTVSSRAERKDEPVLKAQLGAPLKPQGWAGGYQVINGYKFLGGHPQAPEPSYFKIRVIAGQDRFGIFPAKEGKPPILVVNFSEVATADAATGRVADGPAFGGDTASQAMANLISAHVGSSSTISIETATGPLVFEKTGASPSTVRQDWSLVLARVRAT